MRAYIEKHRDQALELVQAAAAGYTPEEHEEILKRLWVSVREGHELVCWLRWGALSTVHVFYS